MLASSQVEQVQFVVDGCTLATFSGPAHEVQLSRLGVGHYYIYVRARRATTSADGINGEPPQTAYNQTWSSPVYLRPAM